jgi:hypothetical protein
VQAYWLAAFGICGCEAAVGASDIRSELLLVLRAMLKGIAAFGFAFCDEMRGYVL